MSAALVSDIARADAARSKLDQPPKVKAAFDKAYDRLVAEPAKVFKEAAPAADKVLGEAVDLGNYIDQHRAGVKMTGSTSASARSKQAGQARFQALVYGAGT